MTNEQKLETQISEALSAYLVAGEHIACAAVERAPGSGVATAVLRRNGVAIERCTRAGEEIARLCDELCAAVKKHPGESMATLAEQLGEPPSRLTTVVARLKQQGRIRTAGSRP